MNEIFYIAAIVVAITLLSFISDYLRRLLKIADFFHESARLENIENSLKDIRYDVSQTIKKRTGPKSDT